MINNVITIIEDSKLKKITIDNDKKDPLGDLIELNEQLILEMHDLDDFFECVIDNNEIGIYFKLYIEHIKGILIEIKNDKFRICLNKIWLEQFYVFCNIIDNNSKEKMHEIIKYEADFHNLLVLINSFSKENNGNREIERGVLLANIGNITSIKQDMIKVNDLNELEMFLNPFPYFKPIISEYSKNMNTNFDLLAKRELSRMYNNILQNEFSFASFYAYIKLKEIEIENLDYIYCSLKGKTPLCPTNLIIQG